MNTEQNLELKAESLERSLQIASSLGKRLKGGEVIEFISDVGGGKTTFVRGLVAGTGSTDPVASPTFTISREYQADSFDIHHYDFYRLDDAGIMKAELTESLNPQTVVLIEWSDVVSDVLPNQRLQIKLKTIGQDSRLISFVDLGDHDHLIKDLL